MIKTPIIYLAQITWSLSIDYSSNLQKNSKVQLIRELAS